MSSSPVKGRRLATVTVVVAVVLALTAGAAWWLERDTAPTRSAAPDPSPSPRSTSPEEPTGWVPSSAERAEARELADGLDLDELAGQLIIARSFSNEASLALVREKHFAGV